ncbi:glycosyltransferase family 2 protein [Motiliproteus coralliicola]|uniref:Glycosyltransferase family 2 protein n=1 Tax=Motiliproteus coralliicola TaxID=2283196 RepID=A0A369WDI6_9GAMM|nr:glycosyltransferase family 2 protein [Motiliproteus coralliicola]RDE18754.1 glycosyltransferase family 2 protein [Motiliproteus coralliicola]
MNRITGIIITLNEEDNIAECIKGISSFCDDIIVVDSLSKDKTVQIAEEMGARVYLQKYLGDGPQRIYGAQFAKNDWILSIDADERPEADMLEAIANLKLDDPSTAYAFRRKSYVGNHWIKAAGFYPDYVTRLYNRTTSHYLDRKSHSKVIAPKTTKLDSHIYHLTYESYAHWLQRLDWFTTRDAWALYERGVKPSNIKPVTSCIGAFIRKMIIKGGIFQGLDGMTVTLTSMMRAYMKYIKLNELHEEKAANQRD